MMKKMGTPDRLVKKKSLGKCRKSYDIIWWKKWRQWTDLVKKILVYEEKTLDEKKSVRLKCTANTVHNDVKNAKKPAYH